MESLGERNKALAKSKHKLKKKEDRYAEHIVQRVNSNPVDASQLAVGDRVEVLSLHQKGDLLTLPDEKDQVVVQLGIARMTVPLNNLVLLNDGSAKANKKKTISHRSSSNIRRRKTMSVSTSIDVRGKNADDARMDVEKYMDDVYISGLKEVTIIHGRGEGILKQEIRRMLKRNPHIASIRPGTYNEGGEGVTIVKMKDEQ
jgi:DNA mismatch repair protein MutS2